MASLTWVVITWWGNIHHRICPKNSQRLTTYFMEIAFAITLTESSFAELRYSVCSVSYFIVKVQPHGAQTKPVGPAASLINLASRWGFKLRASSFGKWDDPRTGQRGGQRSPWKTGLSRRTGRVSLQSDKLTHKQKPVPV